MKEPSSGLDVKRSTEVEHQIPSVIEGNCPEFLQQPDLLEGKRPMERIEIVLRNDTKTKILSSLFLHRLFKAGALLLPTPPTLLQSSPARLHFFNIFMWQK